MKIFLNKSYESQSFLSVAPLSLYSGFVKTCSLLKERNQNAKILLFSEITFFFLINIRSHQEITWPT